MSEPFGIDEHDTDFDHMVETPESLRDEDPEAPPMDRGREPSDRPLGAEKFGTTHAEEREGAPLGDRLAEEVPDVGEHDPIDDIVAENPETFGVGPVEAEQTEEELLGDVYSDTTGAEAGAADGSDLAGRLVEPDEGAHTDDEKDMIATAIGRDGGDLSAEEAAMHVEEQP